MQLTPAHYPGQAPIDAYGNGGFRFAEMSHKGSLMVLPGGIHGWEPGSVDPLTLDDFALLREAGARPEILLIGTGARLIPQPPDLLAALRADGLSVDVMDTGAAARTYNILLAEQRVAGAALIAV